MVSCVRRRISSKGCKPLRKNDGHASRGSDKLPELDLAAHKIFGDAGQLLYSAYNLDTLTYFFIKWHITASQRPAPLCFRCHPDDLLCMMCNLFKSSDIRRAAIVTAVAKDDDRGAPIYRVQELIAELLGCASEIAPGIHIQQLATEDGLHCPVEIVLFKQVSHLNHVGHEGKGAHLGEEALHLVDHVQPEARQVAGGEADVTEQDETGALLMSTTHHRLKRNTFEA